MIHVVRSSEFFPVERRKKSYIAVNNDIFTRSKALNFATSILRGGGGLTGSGAGAACSVLLAPLEYLS